MKKKIFSKSISWILSMLFIWGLSVIADNAAVVVNANSSSGIDNITARADYLYNLTWYAQRNVNGWKNRDSNKFYQGITYHIPYGQPVNSGKYVYWGVSIDDYVSSTQNSSSEFYSKRSSYNGAESTYYAMDCSAFTSYCWGLSSRNTTSSWSSLSVTSYGKCTSENVKKIQQGDTLCLAGSHIVLVSRVYSDGTYEITEETPPQLTRNTYTASKLVSNFSSYTIYRYNNRDNVTPPPNPNHTFPGEEDTSYKVPIQLTAKQKDYTYDTNGNIETNHWIDAGDECYIEKVYQNGYCYVKYPYDNNTKHRWAYARAFIFDIPIIDNNIGHVMSESEAAGRTIPDGDYYIGSEISQDYFLDIPGDNFDTPNGKNIEMWIWDSFIPYNNGYDCFRVEYLNNGFYKIRQLNTNMCLDVNGASLSRDENIQMWEDNGSSAQQWSIEQTSHGYRLRARCNAYYMDVEGGNHAKNTNIRCWDGNDSKAQSFCFIPRDLNEKPISDGVYTIKTNVDRNCFLDVGDVPGNFFAGSNIQIWRTAANDPEEKYYIQYAGDGWYQISEKTSGLLMELADPNSGFLKSSRNVQVYDNNGGKHQLWKIRKNSDGTFFIINKASGFYLDLECGNTNNGTNVSQYPYNGSNAQRWIIESEKSTLSFSETTVNMKKGEAKAVYVSVSGDVYGLTFHNGNQSVCSAGFGSWSNGKLPINLNALSEGTCTIAVSIYDSHNKVIMTKNITINVSDTTPRLFLSETNVNMKKGENKAVYVSISGDVYNITFHNDNQSVCSAGFGSWNNGKIPINIIGLDKGTCHLYVSIHDSNDHIISTKNITINVDDITLSGNISDTTLVVGKTPDITLVGGNIQPLINASMINTYEIILGDKVTFSTKASGGTGSYQYAYSTQAPNGKWYVLKNYSTTSSYSYKPLSAGTYKMYVKVKDSSGNVKAKGFTVNVIAPLKNNSKISSSSIVKGETIVLTASASGGKGIYQYAYSTQAPNGKWYVLKNYSTASSYSYKPLSAGTYKMYVKVKDSSGNVKAKGFTVNVAAPLKNNSKISSSSINNGETITLTASASGGKGSYQYAYSTQAPNGKWYVLKSYSTASSYSYKPLSAGTYKMCVKVKDSSEKVVTKVLTLSVTK